MQSPILNTSFDAVSHAHPLPVQPSSRALEEQRVRALVARQPIAVHLHGLPCERVPTVADVLTPKIRRSPVDEDVYPNHLDVTECWKSLSYSQAVELAMWYQFFHKCLHDEVRTNLCDDLVEDLLQSEDTFDEVYLVPRILDCLRSKSHRVIDLSFVDLIDNMMGMFHDQFPNKAASMASNWSHFSGGLSRFLHNFLRVQDCFRDSPSGPCLEVTFDFQFADSLLTATGDVTWQLPEVRFLSLPSRLSTGEEYRITPFVLSDVLNPVRSRGSKHYVDQVSYTLLQSSLSMSWNSRKQCFKAVVPDFADGKPHTAETVLQASIITAFPDDVRFERQSRWSIKLDVTPAESDCEPSITRTSKHAKLIGGHTRVCDSTEGAFSDAQGIDIWGSENDTVLRTTTGNRPDSQSLQKRKVSKPEVVNEALGSKRRRHKSANEVGNKLSIRTRVGGAVTWASLFERSPSQEAHDSGADNDHSNADQSGADQRHVYSLDEAARIWYRQSEQRDSGTWSPDGRLADVASSAPNSAIDMGHVALQQQQILRNYQEFADRKLFKDAGLVSPVSDGERRAFESIFLEDNEEWSPVTEGSAVDLDAVMGQM